MKFSSFVHILLPHTPEFAELLIQRPERYMRDLNAQEAALKNAPITEGKNVSEANCVFKLEEFFQANTRAHIRAVFEIFLRNLRDSHVLW